MCRSVTRLDGAWGKKQVWRPHVRTWRLSEANVGLLFWKNWLWHCCDFPPPRSDSAPKKLCPPDLSLRLWCYAIKIGKFSENKQIFKSERYQLLFHEHLQFSNTILGLPHRACTDCQQRLLAAFQVSSCSFRVTSDPATRVFSSWTYVCFANNKTFPTFNKLLFKVREVWE